MQPLRAIRPVMAAAAAGAAAPPAPKRRKGAGAAADVAVETPAVTIDNSVNEALLAAFVADMNVIKGHPVFKNIESASALDIDANKKELSGYQATFDHTAYDNAMAAVGKYKCGINFFWLNLLWTPCPGVPLSDSRIELLVAQYFTVPSPMPLDLLIAVPGAAYKPLQHKGGWNAARRKS